MIDADPTPLDVNGKVNLLAEYLERYPHRYVVETGIYLGWGSTMRLPNVEAIPYLFLIDYQDANCQEAYEWLRHHRFNCHYLDCNWPAESWPARLAVDTDTLVVRGRSEDAMPRLMRYIDKPAFFWLDAHEPGTDCPLWAELNAVIALDGHSRLPYGWVQSEHVVLIDDARLYGDGPWPPLEEVITRCARHWDVSLLQDVVRCVPRLTQSEIAALVAETLA
jgi:hypothetical protein